MMLGGDVEMWLGNWNVIVSISWNGYVEMLLYLSPEMESVVFVQIFFSIIYIYIYIYVFYFILWLIYIGTKCYVEMLIRWMELGTCQWLITFHKSILIWVYQFTFYFVLERLCNNIKGAENPFVLAYINNSAHFKAMKIIYQTKRYCRLHINLWDI